MKGTERKKKRNRKEKITKAIRTIITLLPPSIFNVIIQETSAEHQSYTG